MSQVVTRASAVQDEGEKKDVDSPAKDTKKKIAANEEKVKQTDKAGESSKDETGRKVTNENETPKINGNGDNAKLDVNIDKTKFAHNGVSDVTLNSNGSTDNVLNGSTTNPDAEEDDVIVNIENENDELFPELAYDDTSDSECFERDTPENAPSRSLTRRSQVKSTRTPETPRPASDKQTDKERSENVGDSNNKDESTTSTAKGDIAKVAGTRKLRSSEIKPQSSNENGESSVQNGQNGEVKVKTCESGNEVIENGQKAAETEIQECRRETNFSKSRVKVSPYRRVEHDNSTIANYTGNNSTMLTDMNVSILSERPSTSEDPPLESSYLNTTRSLHGRKSYRQLKDLDMKLFNRKPKEVLPVGSQRPCGTVIGRKRKPAEGSVEYHEDETTVEDSRSKKMRMNILQQVMSSFNMSVLSSTPLPARRAAPIVGINSDLPMSAPVSATETFDPETISTSTSEPSLEESNITDKGKAKQRCTVM